MKRFCCPKINVSSLSLGLTPILVAVLLVLTFGLSATGLSSNVYAQTADTVNFQGKIVRNDAGSEGINVSSSETSCIAAGADTCGFQVAYYTASSGGTLLGTETFTNIEIGDNEGVFNLALGTGSYTAGSESAFLDIFNNNTTVYGEINFDHDGNATYTEVFSRIAVRAAAFALNAQNLDGLSSEDFVEFQRSAAQVDSGTENSIFINKTGASGNILQFQKSGVDRLVLNNDGELGIGVSSPQYALDVDGSTQQTSDLLFTGTNGGTDTHTISFPSDLKLSSAFDNGAKVFFDTVGVFDIEEVWFGVGTTSRSVGDQTLVLDVEGPIGGTYYCDEDGNSCSTAADLVAASSGASSFISGSVIFSDGTNFSEDNTNFYWDDTNNRLGIATGVPDVELEVDGYAQIGDNNNRIPYFTNGTGFLQVFADRTSSDATPAANYSSHRDLYLSGTSIGSDYGILHTHNIQYAAGFTGSINGLYGQMDNRSTGTVALIRGLVAGIKNLSTGTVTDVYGAQLGLVNNTGTVGTATGALIMEPTNTGTLTDNVGLVVDQKNAGTNNTHILIGTKTVPAGDFGVYQSNSDDNYFAGRVGIGSGTSSPGYDLDIANTANVGLILLIDGAETLTRNTGDIEFGDLEGLSEELVLFTDANEVLRLNVTGDALPGTTLAQDLGSTTLEWNNLYFGGTLDLGTNTITDGTLTGNWDFSTGNLTNVDQVQFSEGSNHSITANASGLIFDGGDGTPDFRIYDDNIYSDVLTLGYNGTAQITTNDTDEDLTINTNGVGKVIINAITDLNGNELILDADGDSSITADTDDQIDFKIGGSDELVLTASSLYPAVDKGLDLGTSSYYFNDLYLDGNTIHFDYTPNDAKFGFDTSEDKFYFNTDLDPIQASVVITDSTTSRLGVNIYDPLYTLDVGGTARVSDTLFFDNALGISSASRGYIVAEGSVGNATHWLDIDIGSIPTATLQLKITLDGNIPSDASRGFGEIVISSRASHAQPGGTVATLNGNWKHPVYAYKDGSSIRFAVEVPAFTKYQVDTYYAGKTINDAISVAEDTSLDAVFSGQEVVIQNYFAKVGVGTNSPSTGTEELFLDVEGAIGGTHYCDEDGNSCSTAADLAAAVAGGLWSKSGTNLSPTTGGDDVYLGSGELLGVNYDPSTISGGVAAFNGNVGIGETSPSSELHIGNNISQPGILIDSTSSGADWTAQGAYISMGEGSSAGINQAATHPQFHMNYLGNGYGYIGAGGVNSTTGIPHGAYMRFSWNLKSIYTDSNIMLTNNYISGINELRFDDGADHSITSNVNGLLFDGGDGILDFLVYDDVIYSDELRLGYNGAAEITTNDADENLTIDPNGTGSTNVLGALNVSGDVTVDRSTLILTEDSGSDKNNSYKSVLQWHSDTINLDGALFITGPSGGNTMLKIRISGYNHDGTGSWEVIASGYWYTVSNTWLYPNVEIRGSAPFDQVRFMKTTGNLPVISLGDPTDTDNWDYPQVNVDIDIVGFAAQDQWSSGWSATLATADTGYTAVSTPTIPTYITSAGNFGINTVAPSEKLDVNGNGRFRSIGSGASAGALHYTTNGTLTTNTSDVRLKENIVTVDNALDKLLQLRGVTYDWKDGSNNKKKIGLIAQEVDAVVPELSFVNPVDGYYGLHYSDAVGLIIEGIKEQHGVIDTLESDIADLQTQIDGLSGGSTAWTLSGTDLQTTYDVFAGSLTANSADLGSLTTQTISSGGGSFTVDLAGNVGISGDLQADGVLSSASGTTTISGNLDVQDILAKDLDVASIVSQSVSADSVALSTSLGVGTDFRVDASGVRIDSVILATDGVNEFGGTVLAAAVEADTIKSAKFIVTDTGVATDNSAGKATITVGTTSILIETTAVTADSLIYVTPYQTASGDIPAVSVANQIDGEFEIQLDGVNIDDVEINWLVVELE